MVIQLLLMTLFMHGRRLADPATASPYSWFAEIMSLENVGAVMSGEAPPSALGVTALDNHTLEVTFDCIHCLILLQ